MRTRVSLYRGREFIPVSETFKKEFTIIYRIFLVKCSTIYVRSENSIEIGNSLEFTLSKNNNIHTCYDIISIDNARLAKINPINHKTFSDCRTVEINYCTLLRIVIKEIIRNT